jgi:hypothetical protein
MKYILTNQVVPSVQDVPKETIKVYIYNKRKSNRENKVTQLHRYTMPKQVSGFDHQLL